MIRQTPQSLTSSESIHKSTLLLRHLTPQQGLNSARWEAENSEVGTVTFPQANAAQREVLQPRKIAISELKKD